MARRKNTKRIDPRWFLDETTHRDELDEQMGGSFTTNMPKDIPSTADVMRRMTPDPGGVPEKYEELYKTLTSAPYNKDPKETQQKIKACSDEALRGDLSDGDFVKCMYRKDTSSIYAMQDLGMVPQQKGR